MLYIALFVTWQQTGVRPVLAPERIYATMKLATLNDLKKKGGDGDQKRDNELFVGGLDNRGGGSGASLLHLIFVNADGMHLYTGLNVLPNDAEAGGRRGSSDIFDRIMQRAIDGSTSRETGDTPADSDPAGPTRKITLWRNGFSVDDGPLRDPAISESQQFMERLDRGQIPRCVFIGPLFRCSDSLSLSCILTENSSRATRRTNCWSCAWKIDAPKTM